MKKRLLYNVGRNRVDHLQKNIEMFRGMGLECEKFMYFPFRLIGSKWDFIYLNWYENIFQGSPIVAISQYIVKKIALWYMKQRKVTIITSQHNKVQHGIKYSRMSNGLFKTIYKQSSKIVVFSNEGKKDLLLFLTKEDVDEKAVYIPPVNYIGTYPYVEHKWITDIATPKKLTILFIGNLGYPYKNVEMVIDIAKELHEQNIHFILAGKVSNDTERERYINKVNGQQNITAEFRFIDDSEMAQLLAICDIVIAPYDVNSMSNSGTARLAFSYGKSVICPKIPSLESIPDELIYTYTYSDKDDHKKQLKATIQRALYDYTLDFNSLNSKGNELKSIMQSNNSVEAISEKYRVLFGLDII